jgi:hypothetical protein
MSGAASLGRVAHARLAGQGCQARQPAHDGALCGALNRADARREATGHALANDLDSWGRFAVVVIDPNAGKRSLQTGLDPDDEADIARVSNLTGIPPPGSSFSARRRDLHNRLSAGVIACPDATTTSPCLGGEWRAPRRKKR